PAEAQGHLDLVAILDEPDDVAKLDLVVTLVGPGAELHLLDLDDLLLRPRLVRSLLFLVLELAVVHDPADRRIGVRRDLHQVQTGFLGHAQGLARRDDADLLVVHSRQPYLRNMNLTVYAVTSNIGSDALFSLGSSKNDPSGVGSTGRVGTLARDVVGEAFDKRMNGHRPEVDSASGTNGHPTRLALPAADHEQVRHLA